VRCPHCSPKKEQVSWLDSYARLTHCLAQTVAHWCRKLPIRHVAALFGLHWDIVRLLDRRRLAQQLHALPEPEPRHLVMDEFALYNDEQCIRLDELLAANEALATVYVMKAELRALWIAQTDWAWRRVGKD